MAASRLREAEMKRMQAEAGLGAVQKEFEELQLALRLKEVCVA